MTKKNSSSYFLAISRIRIAIVGTGYWGPNVLRNLLENDVFVVTHVCDKDIQKRDYIQKQMLEQLEQQAVHPVFTESWEMVLADPNTEAVAIVTGIDSHETMIEEALRAKKHVFVEKPLATTASACQRLGQLAQDVQRVLMVGHTFIYNPAIDKVKSILNSGELGNIYYLSSQRLNLGRAQTTVNALWSLAVHDVAITLDLFNELPTQVSCWGQSFITPGIEDVIFVHMRFPSGRMAHLHTSWLNPEKRREVILVGDQKMLVYDDVSINQKISIYDKGIQKSSLPDVPYPEYQDFQGFQLLTRVGDVSFPTFDFEEPLKIEMQHFADCILGKYKRPLTSWEEGYNVVRVLECAQASLKQQGLPVNFT